MFRKLFSPDSGLMITLSQITDCIFLSLFWILGSVPVVTAGAASAALYDSVFRACRRGDKHAWGRFWKTYRENLAPGLVPTVLFLAALGALCRGMIGLWNGAVLAELSWAVFSAGALGAVAALGILSVLFPMLSRFQNTLGQLLKNTLLLALANLPRTLALGLVNALAAWLCLRWIFPLFFLPALACLVGTLFLEPMFRPYMPRETE